MHGHGRNCVKKIAGKSFDSQERRQKWKNNNLPKQMPIDSELEKRDPVILFC